jgi:serine/threonine protein kinase/WD40 repeat protein
MPDTERERTRDSLRNPTESPTVGSDGSGVGQGEAEVPESIGEFKILGKLGEGGMGVVFEAEQPHPRRRVALKVLRDGFVDDQQLKMFRREIAALARLKHAGIAAIHESGRTPGGRHYFAMELVRGHTLHEYLEQRPAPDTVDERRHRLELFRRICDAVGYAHQRGVIHCDIKPSNIIVTQDESSVDSAALPRIKVLDFGLARLIDADAQTSLMSEVGVIKGTLPYMSPEQVRADPQGLDFRTDVYSLGVIAYEMLAGKRPYEMPEGSVIEIAKVICEEAPAPLRNVGGGRRRLDSDLETIVGKSLSKPVEQRYDNAGAISGDVARYLQSRPILARPPSSAYQLKKFAQRNRGLVISAAALLLALTAAAVMVATFAVREARSNERLRRDAYLSMIRSATQFLEQGNLQQARETLASTQSAESDRGWEYNYLWAQAAPPGLRIESPDPGGSAPFVELRGDTLNYYQEDQLHRFDVATGERIDSRELGLRAQLDPALRDAPIEQGPDGYRVVSLELSDQRRSFHFFDAAGEPRGVLEGAEIHFGPPGSHVVRVPQARESRIVLWDLRQGVARQTYDWTWWYSKSVSPDGRYISLYRQDPSLNWGTTEVHSTHGTMLARLPVPTEPSVELFSPDGSILLSASGGDLRMLQLNPVTELVSIAAHSGMIDAIAAHGSSGRVATSASDHSVKLWDMDGHRQLAEFHVMGRAAQLSFDPAGRYLLRTGEDRSVTLLDTAESGDINRLRGHKRYTSAVDIHPGGEILASGDWAGVVILWDLFSGRELARLRNVGEEIRRMRFSPDGSRLVAVGSRIWVWDLESGERIATLQPLSEEDLGRAMALPAAGTPLDDAASRILVDWDSADGSATIWDVDHDEVRRHPLKTFVHRGRGWVSGNDRFVVRVDHEGGLPTIVVHEVAGSPVLKLATTIDGNAPFALSHGQGSALLAAHLIDGEDRGGSRVALYRLDSAERIGLLVGHLREVTTIEFSPDDRRIVTGSRDGTIRLWDPLTMEQVAVFHGHRAHVNDLVFDESGRRLISASGDRSLMIWDDLRPGVRRQARNRQQRVLAAATRLAEESLATEVDVAAALRLIERDPQLDAEQRRLAKWEVLRISQREQGALQESEQIFILPRSGQRG